MIILYGLIAIISILLYKIHKSLLAKRDYFISRGLPAAEQKNLFSIFIKLCTTSISLSDYIMDLYNSFPNERLFGLFDLGKPLLFIRDPDLIKQLAIKDFDNFTDHKPFVGDNGTTTDMFANSLFLLKGNRWRNMRATLSPAFTGSKMRQMFELVTNCASKMANHFEKKAKNTYRLELELKDLFRRYANDVIASCAFGISVNSFEEPNNEFFKIGTKILNFQRPIVAIKVMFMQLLPKLTTLLGITFIGSSETNYFRSMILDAIEVRDKQGIYRPDMINILLQLKQGNLVKNNPEEKNLDAGFATVQESEYDNGYKNKSEKPNWTDDELVAQCFLFFLAGFDTTSTLLTFALYEIAIHPNIQYKLYEEVKQINDSLEGKRIQYDTLQNMVYMDQVISESLRKWPPALMTDRICVQDFVVRDSDSKEIFAFEKGVGFWIPIWAIHRSPEYYPDPEKFDPDRFSHENRKNINPNAYIPFGTGPRNCIGSRFALMEIKAVLYSLLLKFEIRPTEKTQIPLKLAKNPMNIMPEKPISLEFKSRNKDCILDL